MLSIVGLLTGFIAGLLTGWAMRGRYVPRPQPVRRVPVLM